MTVKLKLVWFLFLAWAAASGATGVYPKPETSKAVSLLAVNELGQTYLAAKEVRIDLEFGSGKKGKGTLAVLFEPKTGYCYHELGWWPDEFPPSQIDMIERLGLQVVVSATGLGIIGVNSQEINVSGSTEKAGSLDDVEKQAIRWAGAHLDEVETRSVMPSVTRFSFRGPFSLPKGFFVEDSSAYPSAAGFRRPAKLLGVGYRDGYWEVRVENTSTHRVAVMPIQQHPDGTWWSSRSRMETEK